MSLHILEDENQYKLVDSDGNILHTEPKALSTDATGREHDAKGQFTSKGGGKSAEPEKPAAKMTKVNDTIQSALGGMDIAELNVKADDGLASSVTVRGSFDPKDQWANNIFQNSRYFIFDVRPKGKRYYDDGDKLEVELLSSGLGMGKFRRYSGPPDKVAAKIKKWMSDNKVKQ